MTYDPLPCPRANPRNILSFAATRRVLENVAGILCGLEKREADDFLACLAGEIEALREWDVSADIWRQAAASLGGPESYGLERIGLWPGVHKENNDADN